MAIDRGLLQDTLAFIGKGGVLLDISLEFDKDMYARITEDGAIVYKIDETRNILPTSERLRILEEKIHSPVAEILLSDEEYRGPYILSILEIGIEEFEREAATAKIGEKYGFYTKEELERVLRHGRSSEIFDYISKFIAGYYYLNEGRAVVYYFEEISDVFDAIKRLDPWRFS